LETIILMDKTFWKAEDQFTGRYFGNQFINITGSGISTRDCKYGIRYLAGPGSHNIFSDCLIAASDTAISMGDGVQGLGDQTFVNCHLMKGVQGLKIVGPLVKTEPVSGNPIYDRCVNFTGGQFDGNITYTFHIENMKDWRILPNNSMVGKAENVVNCESYLYMSWRTTGYGVFRFDKLGMQNALRFESTDAIMRNVNTSFLRLLGGTVGGEGARVILYGNAHADASRALIDSSETRFRNATGATTRARIDDSGIRLESHSWNGMLLRLGNYRLWIDADGKLRIKDGAPANDTDGTIVGTQS
jgi:hypothetical protein